MTRQIVVIEAEVNVDRPRFRFTCRACRIEGAWHDSLNDAERSGERHARVKHPQAVRA